MSLEEELMVSSVVLADQREHIKDLENYIRDILSWIARGVDSERVQSLDMDIWGIEFVALLARAHELGVDPLPPEKNPDGVA